MGKSCVGTSLLNTARPEKGMCARPLPGRAHPFPRQTVGLIGDERKILGKDHARMKGWPAPAQLLDEKVCIDAARRRNSHLLHLVRVELFLDPLRQQRRQSVARRLLAASVVHRSGPRRVEDEIFGERQLLLALHRRRHRALRQEVGRGIHHQRQRRHRRIRVVAQYYPFCWNKHIARLVPPQWTLTFPRFGKIRTGPRPRPVTCTHESLRTPLSSTAHHNSRSRFNTTT